MVKTGLLKQQVLLEDFDRTELDRIAQIIKRMSFKRGEFLFKEKEDTKGIYLIHSGKIEVSKVTPDGWKQTLAILGNGHFLGELSILERRRHEATAAVIEDTDVFLITKEDFEKMEREDAALASKIIKKIALIMSKNLRRMNEKFLNALISY